MVYPFALRFLSVELARRTGVVRWMPWYRHHNLPVGILTEIDGRQKHGKHCPKLYRVLFVQFHF